MITRPPNQGAAAHPDSIGTGLPDGSKKGVEKGSVLEKRHLAAWQPVRPSLRWQAWLARSAFNVPAPSIMLRWLQSTCTNRYNQGPSPFLNFSRIAFHPGKVRLTA